MFELYASDYFNAGYPVIPILPGTKRPDLNDWARFCLELPTKSEQEYLLNNYTGYGLGLCLGEASKLIAVDIDTDDLKFNWIQSDVEKVGKPGRRTCFFQYNGEKSIKFHDHGIEVLSTGNQTVLPPTIHPDTKNAYVWSSFMELLSYSADDFKIFDLDRLFKQLNYNPDRKTQNTQFLDFNNLTESEKKSEIEKLKKALTYLKANNYDEWFRIAGALKQNLPDEVGFALYLDYSKQCIQKFDAEKVAKKWQEAVNINQISLGTIYHEAKEKGFDLNEFIQERNLSLFSELETSNLVAPPRINKADPFQYDDEFLLSCPGIMGKVQRELIENFGVERVPYAFSAALALGMFLNSRWFQLNNKFGFRTNHGIITIAGSGTGKSRTKEILSHLIQNELGFEGNVFSKIVSDTGFLKSFVRNNGKVLGLFDEIGEDFAQQGHKNRSGHLLGVQSLRLTLLGGTPNDLPRGEYADERNNIPACFYPTYVECGYATHQSFEAAIQQGSLESGLLPRYLFLSAAPKTPSTGRLNLTRQFSDETISLLESHPGSNPFTYLGLAENSKSETLNKIEPRIVPYESGDAKRILEDFHFRMRGEGFEAEKKKLATGAIFNRGGEKAFKIALALSHPEIGVTEEIARFVVKFVEKQVSDSIDYFSNLDDSPTEKAKQIVKKIIAEKEKNGIISKSEISNSKHFRKIEISVRNYVINDLISDGFIESLSVPSSRRQVFKVNS